VGSSAADQQTLSLLSAFQRFDKSSFNGNFRNLPLQNYTGNNFPTDTTAANYALVSDAAVVKRDEFLTYSVVSNNNATLVTASIENNRLTLKYANNQTGTANITVRATDTFGATVVQSFKVTVS